MLRQKQVGSPKEVEELRFNKTSQGLTYARDVINGKILSSKSIVQACKRFEKDIKAAAKPKSKYLFKPELAEHFLQFTNYLIKHAKGPLAGKQFYLEPWQVFLVLNLFGMVHRKNPHIRRFKNCVLFIARKNGKSFFSSVLPIYLMLSGEEGQELYSAATQRSQARIVWTVAGRIISKMPKKYRNLFKKTVSEIRLDDRFSVYQALGRDSKNLDGLNPSLTVFDEAAAVTDRNVVEVLTSANGARENYLNMFITTASTDLTTVFYENYNYCKNILKGKAKDDEWLALIYELDNADEAENPKTWIKSNPNLGTSISLDYLKSEWNTAQHVPTKKINFMIKNLNVWQSSSEIWLDVNILKDNYVPEITTDGSCYVGLDLSGVSDLTSATYIFTGGDTYYQESVCFLPRESMKVVPKHLSAVYANAVEAGQIVLLDGKVIDVATVLDYVVNSANDKGYNIQEVAYDPWQAMGVEGILDEKGIDNIAVRQSMVNLSPTAKEMSRLYLSGKIKQKENKFFEWQFNNVHTYTDVNGNIKLKKGDDVSAKIDSVISLNIGMVVALQSEGEKVFGIA